MPRLLPVLGVLPLLVLTASAAPSAPDVPRPVCVVVSEVPSAASDPPAWMLLAGALVVLGAGRVAAS